MKKSILFLALCFFQGFSAQNSEIFKLKNYRTAILSDSIQENSGLTFFNGKFFTNNDSGNAPILFESDKNKGEINQIFKINEENRDWDAVTCDSTHIYIGDFGNNAGTRKDLRIIKINFKDQHNNIVSNENELTGDVLPFYYPNQTDFSSKNLNTDFDAEAMIYLDGKIHIFTKEWHSKSSTHYTLDPNNKENQAAQKIETYPTGFVISDAYYYQKKLYTVGYTKKTEVFIAVFEESEPGMFFQQKPKQFYLGSALSVGQIEGISVDESGIYISSEKFQTPINKPRPYFYFIPKDKLKL
ncbi:MAG: hypothetical protein KBS61_07585 [Chryseobacterium sp.]|nr:hypothetical protein [Candidatus Chryseobacterium enterohippi]